MAPPRTKRGTPKLSEAARKLVVPSGITSTGWPDVRDTCQNKLGVSFDPWQHGAGRVILAKRADGKLAAMIDGIGMSLPRQVGKTYLVGAMIFALCINMPGLLVIWSAHHARTHGETFLSMQAFAERQRVKPYVRQVFTGSGDEEIRFHNGSRVLFGARERGFGRGVPGVDVIMSDEAQIMSDKALDAQLATMNTSSFGLALFVGTPPRPEDPSEAFTRMRDDAWAGRLTDGAWIEFGADRDDDPNDRKVWAKANPSFPHRTPVESMLRLQRKLKGDSFLREGLGIWDEAVRSDGPPITVEDWLACESDDAAIAPDAPVTLSVEIALDRKSASIAATGLGASGKACPTLLMHDYGTSWVADALIGLAKRNRLLKMHRGDAKKRRKLSTVVIDPTSPAGTLVDPLRAAGIEPVLMTTREVGASAAALQDALWHGRLEHGPADLVAQAIKGAVRRDLGDGLWAFGRRKSAEVSVDITPLVAVANAHWAYTEAIQPYDLMSSFW